MIETLRQHRLQLQTALFLLLLTAATFALLHPRAAIAYRQFRAAATPQLQDSSGYTAHVVCYTTLAIAAVVLLPTMPTRATAGVLVAHGITTESIQAAIPQRTFDPADMMCNVLAATIALAIAETTVRAIDGRRRMSRSVAETAAA